VCNLRVDKGTGPYFFAVLKSELGNCTNAGRLPPKGFSEEK
jgi:hypothetical protein